MFAYLPLVVFVTTCVKSNANHVSHEALWLPVVVRVKIERIILRSNVWLRDAEIFLNKQVKLKGFQK